MQRIKRLSQFNTFPFEDQVRFYQTKGMSQDCKHDWNIWTTWTSVENTEWKRYGRHCKKCGTWQCLAYEDVHPSFSYAIRRDPRGGVSMTLTQNSDGKTKEFWIKAMQSPCQLEMHMRNMTNDIILYQWFKKYKPQKGKKK